MSELDNMIEKMPLLSLPELIELMREVTDQIQIQAMQLVRED